MNLKDYFSNLSCWEEFEIKRDLLGKKKNDPEIFSCFKKIESWYFLVVGGKIYFIDQNGNKVEGKDIKLCGDLCVSDLGLISLEGCPAEVNGCFSCAYSKINSLEGCPKKVGGNFSCSYCHNLKSLKGCPEEISGNFLCECCHNLESFAGHPKKIGGNFYCSRCSKLSEAEILNCKIREKLLK